MRVKEVACITILLLTLMGCEASEIVLTKEHLESATLENFVVSEESHNQVQYVVGKKLFTIINLLVQEINSHGIMYLFLETDTENEQLLVILNEDLNKLQWAEYYTEHCYFDAEELVALVVQPFPDRHLEATLEIYDFKIGYFKDYKTDFKYPLGTSEGDKQAYYLIPIYEKTGEKTEYGRYLIYWKQAHYSFRDGYYSFSDRGRKTYSMGIDSSKLDELEPLLSTTNDWAVPIGYNAIAGNTDEYYDVVFIAPEGEVANWENCEIFYYNRETEEGMQVLFANIFRYQDELLGITPAQNRDERATFIVETKEFNYDFYFDPAGLTTDAFLRPSSFVRLYPK